MLTLAPPLSLKSKQIIMHLFIVLNFPLVINNYDQKSNLTNIVHIKLDGSGNCSCDSAELTHKFIFCIYKEINCKNKKGTCKWIEISSTLQAKSFFRSEKSGLTESVSLVTAGPLFW